jgi:hypothetical protein
MTAEQKQLAIALRSEGMPYHRIAAKIGTSESAAFKFLTGLTKPSPPKPAPIPPITQQKSKLKTSLLPPHQFHGSCPIHRRAVSLKLRNTPQLTKRQMYFDLARAVRNTVRLAHQR